jgi:hypothetical protein
VGTAAAADAISNGFMIIENTKQTIDSSINDSDSSFKTNLIRTKYARLFGAFENILTIFIYLFLYHTSTTSIVELKNISFKKN